MADSINGALAKTGEVFRDNLTQVLSWLLGHSKCARNTNYVRKGFRPSNSMASSFTVSVSLSLSLSHSFYVFFVFSLSLSL